MTKLSRNTLTVLDARVAVPGYDPATVRAGIAHIGVGGFHRAHQAVYMDRLLGQAPEQHKYWGIVGIGLLPHDAAMRDALAGQDHLYTVVAKHADGTLEPRVIGSLLDYKFAPEDPEAVLDVLTDPAIRIVSLTITEGGYHADPATGELVLDDGLLADLEPGAVPATAFGFLVEAIARRREAGVAPFTVMSCDNIQGNGSLACRMLTAFAAHRSPGLAGWIAENVAFPNSMVDRITPVTTDKDKELLAAEFAVEDTWPVVCEPFTQWVLEDNFPAGRPEFEAAGVQLVDDVLPYELMKLRLLNAGHQAIAYLGILAGYRYAHEASQDPLFARFLLAYMEDEATPTLAPVPGVDLAAYRRGLVERFANPAVADTLARLATDASDRIPTFLLPVVRERLAQGAQAPLAALVVAAWARYAEGADEQGRPIDVVDQRRAEVMARAAGNRTDPLAFLRDAGLFGDLVEQERFTAAYAEALRSLHEHGARTTLERWNALSEARAEAD
ncbi:mannitol dehydrogenase [Arthrobacter sp. SW1]|uniref:mannitol dehydrogenase family protein n=1 Tax=Arthrobacter sp. SW1 TaxID=1920889 RepID=UPI000877D428|nr:mannitol dehydrogenase family protein [Arthrobacter sp. SW1]OFI38419.1 mannitol dehydrogenase [Arthrobacter sp. SW1]